MLGFVLSLYRLALRLLPPGFRREWAGAMADEARITLAESRGGFEWMLQVGRLASDLVRTLMREWAESARRSLSSSHGAAFNAGQDIRFAVRALRRTPLFSVLLVATLGLGMGATTAMFSVAHAVLWAPLPYPDADRLVAVWPGKLFSLELYDVTSEGLSSVEELALYGGAVLTLTEGAPTELFGGQVSANYFDVVGVAPALGRGFAAEDAEPGALPVAILGHELWVERFGGDPEVLGRAIALQTGADPLRTVVGVMPADFKPLLDGAEAWIPVPEDRTADEYSSSSFASALGRLSPDASVEVARDELSAVTASLQDINPGQYSEAELRNANVVTFLDAAVSGLRTNLIALLGVVAVVLLISCVNVANLLLSRGAARRREVEIRSALGAGRRRLFAQFATESLVLGVLGGIAGLGVAWVARDLLIQALPYGFRLGDATLGPQAVAFTVVVALGSSLLFGLIPALGAARHSDDSQLPSGGRSGVGVGDLRLQRALVASEITLALVAVFSAVLLVKSVKDVMAVDPGFDAEQVLTFRLTAAPSAYPTDDDVLRYVRDVESALRDVPGVVSVGAVGRLPLGGGRSRISITPDGYEPSDADERPEATHRLVTAGYAAAMGFRLVDGSFPTTDEYREGPLRVYVTQGLAERYWPDGAVGRHFNGPGGQTWLTVAGVIEDVREDGLEGPVLPGVYIPHRDWAWRTMYFVVRTAAEPLALRSAIENAVWAVSPEAPLSRVRTLDQVVARSVENTRLTGRLFTLFGALALLLGSIGVYGVTAYDLSLRRREFGIRVALGASRSALLRRAATHGAGQVLLGIGGGVVLSIWVGRLLARFVQGVQPTSLPVLAGTSLILVLVATIATLLPARRATVVDPTESLRPD